MTPASRWPIALAGAGLAVAFVVSPRPSAAGSVYDFSRCIAESGAVFYGAHWCPFCHRQKEAFGDAADLLPYVECYRAGTKKKRSECRELGIERFPTWVFADGTVRTGKLSFRTLARMTDCPVPDQDGTS